MFFFFNSAGHGISSSMQREQQKISATKEKEGGKEPPDASGRNMLPFGGADLTTVRLERRDLIRSKGSSESKGGRKENIKDSLHFARSSVSD